MKPPFGPGGPNQSGDDRAARRLPSAIALDRGVASKPVEVFGGGHADQSRKGRLEIV